MKKLISLILALCVCLPLTTGCATNDANTLRLWSAVPLHKNYTSALKVDKTNRSALYTKFVLEKFKEQHPDIKVVIEDMGWAETLNAEIVRTAGTRTPDIIGTETYTQNLIDLDYLAPIEWEEEIKNDLIPKTTEIFTRDNKLYGTPMCTNGFTFIYNENLLKEAGCPQKLVGGKMEVIPPSTWSEFFYCAELVQDWLETNKIKTEIDKSKYGAYIVNNIKGMATAFRSEVYLQLGGGSMIKDGALTDSVKKDDLNFTDEANLNGYTLMRELYKYAPVGSYTSSDEQIIYNRLLQGEVAMSIEHPSVVSLPVTGDVALKIAPMPVFVEDSLQENLKPFAYSPVSRDTRTKKGGANVLAGNIAWAVTKDSKKKDLAKDFIAIAISPEAQEYLFELDVRLPTTKSGMERVLASENKTVVKYRDMVMSSIEDIMDSYSDNPTVQLAGGVPCFSQNISQNWIYYETFMKTLYTTNNDIMTALNTLETSIKGKL